MSASVRLSLFAVGCILDGATLDEATTAASAAKEGRFVVWPRATIMAARACSMSARDAAAIEGSLLGHMVRALHAAHDAGQIAGRSRFGVR